MYENLQLKPGSPQPKGAVFWPEGINFALFSRHAKKVSLVLDLSTGSPVGRKHRIEFPLDPAINKTGDIWHILVEGLPETFTYGYRLSGPHDPRGEGHYFDDSLVLIDPYAKALSSSAWGEERSCLGINPCSMMEDRKYDWEGCTAT